MDTAFIEASNGFYHGKFLVGRFTPAEWSRRMRLDYAAEFPPWEPRRPAPVLLDCCGWTERHLLVLDLATGEGALFKAGGYATADLEKHRVRVCPLFEPFLAWLYTQPLDDLAALPATVVLPGH